MFHEVNYTGLSVNQIDQSGNYVLDFHQVVCNIDNMVNHNEAVDKTADTISAAIENSNLSRLQVAEQSQIPYSTLTRKLNKPAPFNVEELVRIAQVLGISPGDLLPTDIFTKQVA